MNRILYALLCIGVCVLLPQLAKAQPTANFTSNIVSGCAPILVQFTDQSTGSPTSWNWNLGNGTTSTLQNPSTTYINPGVYTVTLTVSNGSGSDTKVITNYITVIASPIVNFIAHDSTSCAPKTVQFTNLSVPNASGTTTYFWDFGDGNTSTQQHPTHTYTSNGVYSVTLNVTNSSGCSKVFTKTNYIQLINKPGANFTASNNNSCTLPLNVSFTNNSMGGVSYFWDFGDGGTSTAINPTHTYNSTGSYNVTLIATNANGCKDTIVKPSFVNIGSLTASFTKSASIACTNDPIAFTNSSLPGPGNSTWYFGDGGSFTGTNAVHAYATAGTYTVSLVVNYNNCSDTATQTVTINQGPNVGFSANNLTGCTIPFSTQFSNTTTGATSYLWLFGDGSSSTSANPSHTYTALGSYTVTLIAYGANGCNDTLVMPNYINLVLPGITISANPVSGCAPLTTTFTANIPSGVTVNNYNWSFGDASTGTGGPTASHTYGAGIYSVVLTATTSAGCVVTTPAITINAGQQPVAAFTASPTSACPSQLITFTNTSSIPSGATPAYHWSFGDGNTSTAANPTHAYGNQGNYTVTLTVTINGCVSVFSSTIVIHPPKANFTPVYSCTNKLQVAFTNISTGGNIFAWNFGDGTTSNLQHPPPHTYAAYGTYNVTLTVTNLPSGCTSTHVVPVVVFDVNPQFSANDTVICKNQTVTFTSVSNPNVVSNTWYFGNGNSSTTGNIATAVYPASGLYTVTLITLDSRGCYDTLIKPNYISVGGPTANFSGAPTNGCAPLTVSFMDQSNSGGTGIFARTWRFGDGIISTANVANVAHTYGPGVFTVSLAVTDGNGCIDSFVRTNYITSTKPTANFSTATTTICPGQTVAFTNNSSGSNLTYNWTFGDGSSSTAQTPSHTYTSTGVYTVTLIVTDGMLCSDTLVKTAYINVGGISIGFTASDTFATCPPLAVSFTNTSANASNFTWTFGNGNGSSLSSPSTIYTFPGVYTVKLKGQNGSCMDSMTKSITVLGPTGTLAYAPKNGCSPLTVQFSSTNQNTQLLIWDMDNGVTQSTTSSTHTYTYTAPGKYVPKLLLSDGISCIVPIVGPDTIKVDNVVADFSFSPVGLCGSGTIQFTDTILQSINPVISRNWTFGDGGSSMAHNPSHTYNAPGIYTVTLITGTAQSCMDTVVKTVTILTPPTVSAGNNISICQGNTTPVQLQANGASAYTWAPSSGLSCTSCPNPQVNPSVTTTYTVIGTSANGCTDTAQVTVTVNPLPLIQTGPNPTICAGSSVQLLVSGAATYSWSPATDLSCTNCSNPVASPPATATYTVTGTSTAGCSNTAQITVNVNNNPNITASASNNNICAGDSTQLQASGGTTYTWFPATGLSCTNCPNPTATPTTTTTYTVTGTNGSNCIDTAMVTIVVNPLPVLSAPNHSICLGSPAQLQISGAASYVWSPAAGLSCINCPNPIANPSTTTTYTITGTSPAGCVNTTQTTVTVNSLPVISAGNDQTTCFGNAVTLQASGASSYTWTPASGLSCTNCPNPSANPAGTTTYTAIGADVNGCRDTAQVTVNVNPLPVVNAGPDKAICSLNTVQLQATGATTYVWTPASSLSCNNCPNPVASPVVVTTYTVTGTDANGCSNSDNVVVSIHPQPQINAGSDQTICRGQSIQLQATGGTSYVWSPASGLSCSNCPNPTATPTANITYNVVGTDLNGCNDSDKVTITVIQMQPFVIGSGDTLCEGESAQLFASGGDQYQWSPSRNLSNSSISNPVATPTSTTTYTVIIRQGDCFSDTGRIVVVVHPKPTVNAGPDERIVAGQSVLLSATGTHTDFYKWSPAEDLSCNECSAPLATPKQTTTFKVIASNSFGCQAEDDVTIFITCDNSQLFIPNTFTPNADGNNDRFYPSGKGLAIINRMRIFNRWGEMLYEVQNFQPGEELKGWDGTYKGEYLKPDVFVYLIEATCYNGSPMQLKGDVSLLR